MLSHLAFWHMLYVPQVLWDHLLSFQLAYFRHNHRYELEDLSDIHKHLTNTARSAEDINFDEKTFVKVS